jgi:predicted MPP superfamily phosphohydrolase
LISRRTFIKGMFALSAAGVTFGGHALAQSFRLRVTRYAVSPRGWPRGLRLKLAVIADLHVIDPWMSLPRVAQIVARTNALEPDAVLLLGDYVPNTGMQRWADRVGGGVIPSERWSCELGRLRAPLGVHAVLGNHDWWEDRAAQQRGCGPVQAGLALERSGISVYENNAVRLNKQGTPFWVAGLGDQDALLMDISHSARRFARGAKAMTDGDRYTGVDDLAGTLLRITDDAPVILMAHEPDIFAEMGDMGDRVSLMVCGHTHGGQVRLLNYAPIVPSRYGGRYAYGHIVEEGRHLVVSAGLGCSRVPIRFGAPPEIVMIEVGGEIR